MTTLPRHAAIYLLIIGLLSLFQIVIGANLLVLVAIDLVCLTALVPMTRKAFDPVDLLFISLSFYYGTFSLVLKSLVFQPVQENLQVPLLTSIYLVSGFGLIFLAYLYVTRAMSSYYPGTRLRTWGTFERSYADPRFLSRFTLPLTLAANLFAIIIAMSSHSVQEVANGLAKASSLTTLGSLVPIIQLALAMQLSLLTRRGAQIDRTLVFLTLGVGLALSVLNNQKALGFMLGATCAVHMVAYRVRVRPRILVIGIAGAMVMFLYITPLIHIVRGMDLAKSDRIAQTFQILQEAHFNPLELSEIEAKMPGAIDENALATRLDYLAPYNLNTDRFTQLMPIDQTARATLTEPIGLDAYFTELASEILPKFLIKERSLDALPDQIAWRFGIRETNVISRPTLGLLGTSFGVAGPWGILVIAPLIMLGYFVLIKRVCNGSIWQNPWAVFIASTGFFFGEQDLTLPAWIARTFLPLLLIAALIVAYDRLFNRTQRNAHHNL
ncbi:hypothetical protein [Novosphingobium sp.]|uniref:hypothetical protein n=1 Tax=Novosphingobium sp. TaxID=1874826 RepID=UPI003D0BFF2B